MAKHTVKRTKGPNRKAIQELLSELKAFMDEFDETDAESTQVMLDTHISNLLDKKVIRKPKKPKNILLEDVLRSILGSHQIDGAIDRAEMVQELIDSYGGEPSNEDMEEAKGLLDELIQKLSEYLDQAPQPNDQT
jgi:hypothetical protein